MKILTYILRKKGGVGRVISSLEPELKKLGHTLEVVSREDDLKCFSLLDSIKKMNKDIKQRSYDVILTNDWSIALPFLFKENHFSLFHGMEDRKLSKTLQKLVGSIMGENLMVVSFNMKRKFRKANLTQNGVDPKKFFDMKKTRRCFGWVKRDYDLINESEVRFLAKQRRLKVSIAENIRPDKMNEWYNSLEVFISMPPEKAGFNLCWLEAFRAGVPVILGNDNGVGIDNIRDEDFTIENQARKINEIITT